MQRGSIKSGTVMNASLAIVIALIATSMITGANLHAQQLHNAPSGTGRTHVIAKVITAISGSSDSFVSRDGGRTWLRATSVAPASLQDSALLSGRQKPDTRVEPAMSMASAMEHTGISDIEMQTVPADVHPPFHCNDFCLSKPSRY
jgi:hypothetical protein